MAGLGMRSPAGPGARGQGLERPAPRSGRRLPPPAGPARRRSFVLGLWVGLLLLGLAGRLFEVQVLHGGTLAIQAAAERGALDVIPLPATRGEITDSSGQILAISEPAARVVADPSQIPAADRQQVATQLAAILTTPVASIVTLLSGPGRYAVVQDGATQAQGDAVQALGLPGIAVIPSSRREYPDGFFLGGVLGFVNVNGGAAGVEESYNSALAGTNGHEVLQTAALIGGPIVTAGSQVVAARPGLTLRLTIDAGLQAAVEQEVEATVATTGASSVYALVMQPSTGAILADATWPTYDPNSYGDASAAVWDNTVQGQDIVPGSVFKPITVAAALEDNVVGLNTPFQDPGVLEVDGVPIHDFETLERQTTFLAGFEESSNVVFGTVGLDLGLARFYQYLQAFGILQQAPGSDLPGEQQDVVVPQASASSLDLAEEAFGETLEVTPLSLLTAINAIANGGVLVRPHVGAALVDPTSGRVVKEIPVERERQVISPAVAATVRQMMLDVVDDGTGQRGFIPCYDVAGKTGTANIYDSQGISDHFIASFVAFAPAADPAAIVLVMIEDPKGPQQEGGEVAAPAVQAMLSDALHTLGVPPACTATNQVPPAVGSPGTTPLILDMVTMPALVGLTPAAATAAARQDDIELTVVGTGTAILRQDPEPDAMVQRWTAVQAYTSPAALLPPSFVAVPNVVGTSMAAAANTLSAAGLAMVASGAGHALTQQPAAGQPAAPGSSVEVSFGSR